VRIGIDFDNTLVNCDPLFLRAALERGDVPEGFSGGKEAVRERVRGADNDAWTELQGRVYGVLLPEAPAFPGAREFVALCRREEVPVHVVSHKTRRAARGPGHDLRAAAHAWLERNGFYGAGGLAREDVFFEQERAEKLRRIGLLGCTHFIDDLEEVFAEPAFPRGVSKWLFSPGGGTSASADEAFADWGAVARRFQEDLRGRAR
jgi:hypothetical protein